MWVILPDIKVNTYDVSTLDIECIAESTIKVHFGQKHSVCKQQVHFSS